MQIFSHDTRAPQTATGVIITPVLLCSSCTLRDPLAVEQTSSLQIKICCVCRYSNINSLSDLYHASVTQRELQTVAPTSRWDTEASYNPNPQPGQVISRFGSYVESSYAFDSAAFGLQQGEALLMDPQQRLLLEETLTSFHDADYTARDMTGSSTGVFVG